MLFYNKDPFHLQDVNMMELVSYEVFIVNTYSINIMIRLMATKHHKRTIDKFSMNDRSQPNDMSIVLRFVGSLLLIALGISML